MASESGFDLDRDALVEPAPPCEEASPPADGATPPEAPVEVPAEAAPEDETARRLREAGEWKEKGNAAYLLKDYAAALTFYDTALEGTEGWR